MAVTLVPCAALVLAPGPVAQVSISPASMAPFALVEREKVRGK
jgi:hypothetical protein